MNLGKNISTNFLNEGFISMIKNLSKVEICRDGCHKDSEKFSKKTLTD